MGGNPPGPPVPGCHAKPWDTSLPLRPAQLAGNFGDRVVLPAAMRDRSSAASPGPLGRAGILAVTTCSESACIVEDPAFTFLPASRDPELEARASRPALGMTRLWSAISFSTQT